MKFLIIDDHSIVREGIAVILRQARRNTLVLEARSIPEGVALAAKHNDLDAILLDLSFPNGWGLGAIASLKGAAPDTPVLILSSSEDPGDVRAALARGARGYVPKSASAQVLVSALNLVISGNVYLPSFLADPDMAQPGAASVSLTGRQKEVLKAICRGLSNKDIGMQLDMSEKTVKVHITAIFRALNVVNRTQAMNAARSARLVD